eukprot:jgi/Mesen1/2431/ME000157S01567
MQLLHLFAAKYDSMYFSVWCLILRYSANIFYSKRKKVAALLLCFFLPLTVGGDDTDEDWGPYLEPRNGPFGTSSEMAFPTLGGIAPEPLSSAYSWRVKVFVWGPVLPGSNTAQLLSNFSHSHGFPAQVIAYKQIRSGPPAGRGGKGRPIGRESKRRMTPEKRLSKRSNPETRPSGSWSLPWQHVGQPLPCRITTVWHRALSYLKGLATSPPFHVGVWAEPGRAYVDAQEEELTEAGVGGAEEQAHGRLRPSRPQGWGRGRGRERRLRARGDKMHALLHQKPPECEQSPDAPYPARPAYDGPTLVWQPEPGKYLLAICSFGDLEDQLGCMSTYFLFAALLNRTLVVPPWSLSQDTRNRWQWELALNVTHAQACLGGSGASKDDAAAAVKKVVSLDTLASTLSLTPPLPGSPNSTEQISLDKVFCFHQHHRPCLPPTWGEVLRQVAFPNTSTSGGALEGLAAKSGHSPLRDATDGVITLGDLSGHGIRMLALKGVLAGRAEGAASDASDSSDEPGGPGGGGPSLSSAGSSSSSSSADVFEVLNSACPQAVRPHALFAEVADGFLATFTGHNFAAVHVRGGPSWDAKAGEFRHMSISVVAQFLLRALKNTSIGTVLLVSNVRRLEVFDLQRLLIVGQEQLDPDGERLVVITMPRLGFDEVHPRALSPSGYVGQALPWAGEWSSLHHDDNPPAVLLASKLIAARAKYFFGTAGSPLSLDIHRLREAEGTATCRDGDISSDPTAPRLTFRLRRMRPRTGPGSGRGGGGGGGKVGVDGGG